MQHRRDFLAKTGIIAVTAFGGASLLGMSGCKKEDDISPTEDLMREHGILNRILLVYDHFRGMIAANQSIDPGTLNTAAMIIQNFVENYHEKQEEDFLFPRFEKAGNLVDLVQVLRTQHQQGRKITGQLLQLSKQPAIQSESDKKKLHDLLYAFLKMYRPHEAREDTVLFPALRKMVSKHELDSLGEEFEKNEHKMFGGDGFDIFVAKTTELEKQLGVYDLAQFTPQGI